MSKQIKKQITEAKKKLKVAGQKVDHITKVVEGFNFLVEKKAVVIDGHTVYLYKDLWGSDPKTPDAWMANAYIYLRVKKLCAEGDRIYFKDIETDERIGVYMS
ncbi:hypothetical protein [Mongoliitalea lutea]|uniref:Uncharacterized protein n=1 Tax=Mongoliitalea lutea TaxID=849756 RepID=A0A8J3D085_9BACT|nr:hypothetical protein [Mongoliitalea lutea]GHB44380.1 hypothetical protein GCM10008106_26800 [Mongoliitalea lutea]